MQGGGFASLLVANRGEIAIRVLRAAAELGLRTVAVYSEDDGQALHTRRADEALPLRGAGPAAYLDAAQLVALAQRAGCQALHPGYGFLSENAAFAQRCTQAGIVFVGPTPELLELFGDKLQARALAGRCGVPLLPAAAAASLPEARDFVEAQGGRAMLKAVAGGGGRGMRIVRTADELELAWKRCAAEAQAGFGSGALFLEKWLPRARHIEVQIAGDGAGNISHFHERECSVQRRHQKLIEIAPSPALPPALRERLLDAALRMARAAHYNSLGTFEFLLDADSLQGGEPFFAFIEANPRLQVEHTVTEAVTGVDLVKAQLQLAAGRSLAELGLQQSAIPAPRGFAIELRINMEKLGKSGAPLPSVGTLSVFEPPTGPGLRTDSFGYAGYRSSPRFDSLLAKLIAHSESADFGSAVARAQRALCEFRIEGVATNLPLLHALLRHPDFAAGRMHTRFVEEHSEALAAAQAEPPPRLFFSAQETPGPASGAAAQAGAGAGASAAATAPEAAAPPGSVAVAAPLQGSVLSLEAQEGAALRAGDALLIMEAMKMEHIIESPQNGVLLRFNAAPGEAVAAGHPLAFIAPRAAAEASAGTQQGAKSESGAPQNLAHIRPDLAELRARRALGLDAARPEARAKRAATGQRTARENVEDLCDPGSFIEYGPLVIAAQRRRRKLEDLIRNTPADGLVAGIGSVNGERFGAEDSRCAVLAYDYSVLAGTQGQQNHRKKDRLFELAHNWRLPVVLFAEGGGGRPGDTDGLGVAGLDCLAFQYFAKLSGHVPLVGIVSGRCFAGNAALLGCCDVVIATEGCNIGMGGPAMIEGGGLGVFRPEEIGPLAVQAANGVVDIAVADEAEAVRVARRYLAFFQGRLNDWDCADQRRLRGLIPENRRRIYDVRAIIETLADADSLLELRRGFGAGMVTALLRIEGRPLGIIANNPAHLAGAINSDGADKAARFMQLCDAFHVPLLFLCDTPGILVGPEAEKSALVRHAARLFVTGASLRVPFFTIVLRKAYGLGAQAMAGGSFKAPFFTVAWPTGEFGGMGLEGAVKLGYRRELDAAAPGERNALYEQLLERMIQHGKALNTASHFELDDVIDPAESREWIARALRALPPPERGQRGGRPCVDAW
ncbi:MAG: carbamoyl-phosphate synthase large subunit [Deltaproteobacteria bacterium]|nr:carbamoyl-phosphate synthase large subunit [Deltaproteobacteria bacterium]